MDVFLFGFFVGTEDEDTDLENAFEQTGVEGTESFWPTGWQYGIMKGRSTWDCSQNPPVATFDCSWNKQVIFYLDQFWIFSCFVLISTVRHDQVCCNIKCGRSWWQRLTGKTTLTKIASWRAVLKRNTNAPKRRCNSKCDKIPNCKNYSMECDEWPVAQAREATTYSSKVRGLQNGVHGKFMGLFYSHKYSNVHKKRGCNITTGKKFVFRTINMPWRCPNCNDPCYFCKRPKWGCGWFTAKGSVRRFWRC